jgi:hypothetical protein
VLLYWRLYYCSHRCFCLGRMKQIIQIQLIIISSSSNSSSNRCYYKCGCRYTWSRHEGFVGVRSYSCTSWRLLRTHWHFHRRERIVHTLRLSKVTSASTLSWCWCWWRRYLRLTRLRHPFLKLRCLRWKLSEGIVISLGASKVTSTSVHVIHDRCRYSFRMLNHS